MPALWYVQRTTVASGLNVFRWETMQDTETFWTRLAHNATSADGASTFRMSGPYLTTNEIVDYPQEVGSNPLLYGGTLHDSTHPNRNQGGTLFDWYWCSRNVAGSHLLDLDTMPLAGNRTFVCVGDCVWGWLDDSATDLSYT